MDSYSGTYIENSRCNSKILPVLDYIAEHLAEDISIDQLASCFYMSRYYLMHLFKQETGYSVASYISTKRLLRARALIRTACLSQMPAISAVLKITPPFPGLTKTFPHIRQRRAEPVIKNPILLHIFFPPTYSK